MEPGRLRKKYERKQKVCTTFTVCSNSPPPTNTAQLLKPPFLTTLSPSSLSYKRKKKKNLNSAPSLSLDSFPLLEFTFQLGLRAL